ncbi:lipase member H [Leptinotarsa decemlineata]|uniref:lipase member H n=1 Tax=Leptinotarsa decemlineata TaxID=7539 RepID=UPI003D30C743
MNYYWFVGLVLNGITTAVDNSVMAKDDLHAINPTNIGFYFYDRNNPSTPFEINDMNISNSSFNISRNTVFVTHGFTESFKDCSIIKDAFLKKHDVNIIVIDWSKYTMTAYLEISELCDLISSFIKKLVSENDLQLSKTSLVGFSLGAHIMGVVGRDLGGSCDQVIGLDPVGIGFHIIEASQRLSTSSGKFVHVIHTNGDQFGYYQPLGHADYYPNGGKKQPGCEWEILGVCDHLRSMDYFGESVSSGRFRALKCNDYSQFQQKNCSADVSFMGEFPVDKRASGIYFLDTNEVPPYAKG